MSSGILLVDKPQGITSHDVVARTRKLAGTRRVGHAGTLDPMATGLLILGVNASTRLLTFVVGRDKEYVATIRLGQSTTTDDAEGDIVETANTDAVGAISDAAIADGISELTGDISQIPSSVSAIKVDGKRAYALVRAGETVELKSRPVTVSAFELLERRDAAGTIDLDVRVECSTGTYIRALARDLGTALGVGGHLTALRRTRIGPFDVANAPTLDDLDVAASLVAPADAASVLFPAIPLTESQAVDLGHGKRLDASALALPGEPGQDGLYAAVAPDRQLVGLVRITGGVAKSAVNFPADPTAVVPGGGAA
ncbi:tRNA pseudouridine(55) synthase TruB [Mycetocola manganoxydans]|uniref:tRNA pseudouridine(55) synthase TruB n=1 Tax=Mycetocola manganoxydans TaxID=699879 RepID=UPI00198C2943|nr:tRNA pseudouridine(55) synthase TruB [Mycetocola manganoxydans]GHD50281.1 tRNA pseudouridine synthase B [Mycetocola manganoxydans]